MDSYIFYGLAFVLLIEMASLGKPFAITRMLINIPGIIIIGLILSKMVSRKEIDILYDNASRID